MNHSKLRKRVFLPSVLLLFILLSSLLVPGNTFRRDQQKAPKVLQAYREKWSGIKSHLLALHADSAHFELFIRIFKHEKIVEAWVRTTGSGESFRLYNSWPVCASSGVAGPKRREGDGQVPEGFYSISVFNPYSNYFVSLGLNYPNASDRVLGDRKHPGGAIMIHGNCVTIGCIPLTDEIIKEVYVLAAEARNGGQGEISVHVFPCNMNRENMALLEEGHATRLELLTFWKNLKTGYDMFETSRIPPSVSVNNSGAYVFR